MSCRLRSLLNIREADRAAARVVALAFAQHAVLNILNAIDSRQLHHLYDLATFLGHFPYSSRVLSLWGRATPRWWWSFPVN
jgi:hypothetical protein